MVGPAPAISFLISSTLQQAAPRISFFSPPSPAACLSSLSPRVSSTRGGVRAAGEGRGFPRKGTRQWRPQHGSPPQRMPKRDAAAPARARHSGNPQHDIPREGARQRRSPTHRTPAATLLPNARKRPDDGIPRRGCAASAVPGPSPPASLLSTARKRPDDGDSPASTLLAKVRPPRLLLHPFPLLLLLFFLPSPGILHDYRDLGFAQGVTQLEEARRVRTQVTHLAHLCSFESTI
jgi:hypothetical protein